MITEVPEVVATVEALKGLILIRDLIMDQTVVILRLPTEATATESEACLVVQRR
jgi:hypothetical protein